MERTHIEKGGRSTTKESTRGNPWKKENPRSTVEKMERLTGLNKLPAYMKRKKTLLQVLPVGMRNIGIVFDGSTSVFENQRVLYNAIRHAFWLGQLTLVRHDYLHFVQAKLQAFFQ
jgi:hypothetical protein